MTEQPPARPQDPAGDAGTGPSQPDATRSRERQAVPARPPRTRTSLAFNGFVAGAIVLILLLIFILENTESVHVSYFGAGTHLPLGVALLLAAVGGALLVGILGAARIAQVRRHAKRRARSQAN